MINELGQYTIYIMISIFNTVYLFSPTKWVCRMSWSSAWSSSLSGSVFTRWCCNAPIPSFKVSELKTWLSARAMAKLNRGSFLDPPQLVVKWHVWDHPIIFWWEPIHAELLVPTPVHENWFHKTFRKQELWDIFLLECQRVRSMEPALRIFHVSKMAGPRHLFA